MRKSRGAHPTARHHARGEPGAARHHARGEPGAAKVDIKGYAPGEVEAGERPGEVLADIGQGIRDQGIRDQAQTQVLADIGQGIRDQGMVLAKLLQQTP